MNVLTILQGPAYGDERGIADAMFLPQARRSSLDEVTDWARWADKTIMF